MSLLFLSYKTNDKTQQNAAMVRTLFEKQTDEGVNKNYLTNKQTNRQTNKQTNRQIQYKD